MQDPYIVAIVGSDKQRTETHQEGGKNPKWTDQLLFPAKAASMMFMVFDEDIISDDVVGSTTVPLTKYYNNPGILFQENFSISYQGKSAGNVRMLIKYLLPDSNSKRTIPWANQNNTGNQNIYNNSTNTTMNNRNQPYQQYPPQQQYSPQQQYPPYQAQQQQNSYPQVPQYPQHYNQSVSSAQVGQYGGYSQKQHKIQSGPQGGCLPSIPKKSWGKQDILCSDEKEDINQKVALNFVNAINNNQNNNNNININKSSNGYGMNGIQDGGVWNNVMQVGMANPNFGTPSSQQTNNGWGPVNTQPHNNWGPMTTNPQNLNTWNSVNTYANNQANQNTWNSTNNGNNWNNGW